MNRRIVALLASATLMGACGDSTGVPDLNNVSAETIKGGLTTASGQLLVTGMFNQYRNSAIGNYVTFPETMARDAVRMDKAETRYLTELIGSTQPDNGAFTGAGVFTAFFVGIRSANTLVDAVTAATDASGFNAAQRQGLIGIGKTIMAINYWNVMEMRDSVGMPVALNQDINAAPADWICKANVLKFISTLLDDASTSLLAGGTSFAVTLPAGYRAVAGTPAGFNRLNRAFKAKVELYRALSKQNASDGIKAPETVATSLAAAATALGQSFMQSTDLSASGLALGVYQNYSTASGETTNSRVDAALHLNQAVKDSLQAGDLRGAKILTVTTPYNLTVAGATVITTADYIYSVGSSSLTVPLPIMKNEELLLLRAQVAIEANDVPTATTYLNFVRQNSGGLAAYAGLTQATARNALLYEKRYSLLMEGPHRLNDLRAYGRFVTGTWTQGSASRPFANDAFTRVLPIPINELNARGILAGGTVTTLCP